MEKAGDTKAPAASTSEPVARQLSLAMTVDAADVPSSSSAASAAAGPVRRSWSLPLLSCVCGNDGLGAPLPPNVQIWGEYGTGLARDAAMPDTVPQLLLPEPSQLRISNLPQLLGQSEPLRQYSLELVFWTTTPHLPVCRNLPSASAPYPSTRAPLQVDTRLGVIATDCVLRMVFTVDCDARAACQYVRTYTTDVWPAYEPDTEGGEGEGEGEEDEATFQKRMQSEMSLGQTLVLFGGNDRPGRVTLQVIP